MDILNQIGGLLLGSVPTAILLLLLFLAYTQLVRKPLERTLADRRNRTIGAIEQARGAIAAAEAETAVFEDKLRVARQEIAAWREAQAQARQRERDAALAEARAFAGERVRVARMEIESAAGEAREQIEQSAQQLSQGILHVLLDGAEAQPAASEVRS
jgi:F-type H+-transporting ATPase subunit b